MRVNGRPSLCVSRMYSASQPYDSRDGGEKMMDGLPNHDNVCVVFKCIGMSI